MSAVERFRLENLNIDTKWSIIPVLGNCQDFNDFTLVSGNLRVCLSFKPPHQLEYVLEGNGKSFTGETKEYDKFTVSKILSDWSKGEIYVHLDLKL